MDQTPSSTEHPPFKNDIEYIEAESAWVRARCARLDHERRVAEKLRDVRRETIGTKPPTVVREYQRRLEAFHETERNLRVELDFRLAATRTGGMALGLDTHAGDHGLGEVERVALLLSTLAALSDGDEDEIAKAGRTNFHGRGGPEVVWDFMGLSFADRIAARQVFLPTAPLVADGLLVLTVGNSDGPRELRCAYMDVTTTAFDTMLGLSKPQISADKKAQ
jgi:hypothetical protein